MRNYINIAGRKIGPGRPVFIIAEAGVNHNGSLKLAKKMIDVAKSSGVDAIKFQTFKTEELVTQDAPKAGYQKKNTSGVSQFEMLKKLELSESEFTKLFSYCKKKNIMFLSTPFDHGSAELLYKLRVPAFKISSGDVTNIPFLLQIGKYNKPIILSTGMATLKEIQEVVKSIYSTGNKKLILLHCTSNYPTKYENVNLRAMDTLKKKFNIPVGYSDHTLGIEVSVAAAAQGACVIEKHFTLDRNLPGSDHRASLEPGELRHLVWSIRNIEKAIGDGIKIPKKSEIKIKKIARKSIVATCDIQKGTKISRDMLSIKRPGAGISPKCFNLVIGRKTKIDIKKENSIMWDMIKQK